VSPLWRTLEQLGLGVVTLSRAVDSEIHSPMYRQENERSRRQNNLKMPFTFSRHCQDVAGARVPNSSFRIPDNICPRE
jgi:hypothetical protein